LARKKFAYLLNNFHGIPVKACNREAFMMFNARRLKMNPFTFSVFFVAAGLAGIFQNANAQAINATMQTSAPRVAVSRAAPAANARVAPQVIARPVGVPTQGFNPSLPRTITQSPINPQHSYSPPLRSSNPTFTALNVPPSAPGQQTITVDPATRQTELRTLAVMRERRGYVKGQPAMLDVATRKTELRNLETMREQRPFGINNQTLGTINARRRAINNDPVKGPQRDAPEPKEVHGKKGHGKKDRVGYNDASRRHWHEWHDRNWWHNNCETIVVVNTGYYFLDGSYWYPAYGYDPLQTYYDYDGPIYTYSNLLPDEVIANVQNALQDAGYYYGPITGSLSINTRAAIANFQRDYGLQITGAIDEETVEALGLYQSGTYQSGDVLDSNY
jgi:Putative peptidoglycan binding domain